MSRKYNLPIQDSSNKKIAQLTKIIDGLYLGSEETERNKNLLIENKIDILEFDQIDLKAVDSIFPNNWLSTHGNNIVDGGLLIIYPMKAESRRIERNEKIINFLKPNYKHFLDLSYLEEKNE